MTSPARWSSRQMSARMARTSSRSGGFLASRSSAASALRRMAPSGWFSSCARPVASWAMVDMRPTWASSARSRSISASSCLRAVTSTMAARTSGPSSLGTGLNPISAVNAVPSLRRAETSRPRPMARALGAERNPALSMPRVIAAKRFWHQDLDRLARQFLARVAEEALCLRVDQQHPAFAVHQHDSAGRGFHDSAELFLCPAICCSRTRNSSESLAARTTSSLSW